MAIRFTVQGDDEAETAAGLALLLSLGLAVRMPPRETVGNGWMARAIPAPATKPPVGDGRGLGVSG